MWGPSQKILHARGVGAETWKSVTRVRGTWGALRSIVFLHNWLLGTPFGVTKYAFPLGNCEKNKMQKNYRF